MTIVIIKIIIEIENRWKKGKVDLKEIVNVDNEEDVKIEIEEEDEGRMRSLAIGNEDILSTIIYTWMWKK